MLLLIRKYTKCPAHDEHAVVYNGVSILSKLKDINLITSIFSLSIARHTVAISFPFVLAAFAARKHKYKTLPFHNNHACISMDGMFIRLSITMQLQSHARSFSPEASAQPAYGLVRWYACCKENTMYHCSRA